MAEDTAASAAPLPLVKTEADGYCDPVTGVCASPGAAVADTDHDHWRHAEHPSPSQPVRALQPPRPPSTHAPATK